MEGKDVEAVSVGSTQKSLAVRRERKQKLKRNLGLRWRPLGMDQILAHMKMERNQEKVWSWKYKRKITIMEGDLWEKREKQDPEDKWRLRLEKEREIAIVKGGEYVGG